MVRTYLLKDYATDNFKAHTHPIDAIITADATIDEVQDVIYDVKRAFPDDYNSDDIERAICGRGWDIYWISECVYVEW